MDLGRESRFVTAVLTILAYVFLAIGSLMTLAMVGRLGKALGSSPATVGAPGYGSLVIQLIGAIAIVAIGLAIRRLLLHPVWSFKLGD